MNISLTPKLEQFIKKQVKTGRYLSSSEVVRDALRLLDEQERHRELRLKELQKEIRKGLDQLDRGEYIELTKETMKSFFDDIKRRGRQRLARQGNGKR